MLFVCFFIGYLACAWIAYAYFEAAPKPQSAVDAQTEKPLAEEGKMVPWKDYQDVLRTEREELQKQAKEDFDRMERLQDRVFYGVVLLGGIILGLIGFLFGQTRKDVKAQLTDEIGKSVRSQIEQGVLSKVKAQIEEQLKQLEEMNREMTAVQAGYQKLDSELKQIQSYKDRLILWFFSGETNTAEREIAALKNAGFENVRPQMLKVGEHFELGNPDLVIFSYDESEEGERRLKVIASLMKKNTPDGWLMIHSSSNNAIKKEKEGVILGDLWYVPANFPATIVTNAMALIRKRPKF
jgi:hypothetical protein